MSTTVIVPVYNGAATLGDCLASIAAQTVAPDSVIVVDDGSTDGSTDVARASALARLRVLSLGGNGGPGAARNAGASATTTEWLAFLDADNTWAPTFLEEMLGALTASGADFATAGGIRQRSFPRATTYRRLLDEPPTAADRTSDFWRINWRYWLAVPSGSIVRRSIYEAAGGFPEDVRSGEDITLFSRLWLAGRFCFVNRPLYTSVQTAQSITAGGPSYHDVRLMLGRVGACLLRALRRRRPGSGWFIAGYAKMVVGRHRAWLVARLARRGRPRPPLPGGPAGG